VSGSLKSSLTQCRFRKGSTMAFIKTFSIDAPNHQVGLNVMRLDDWDTYIGFPLEEMAKMPNGALTAASAWVRENHEKITLYCEVDSVISRSEYFDPKYGHHQLHDALSYEDLQAYLQLPWLDDQQKERAIEASEIKQEQAELAKRREREGRWISESRRTAIYERDAYRCRYCGDYKKL